MTTSKPLPRTLKALNARFAADGLPVELVRGEGYLYFIYEDGNPHHYDSRSVYTPRFSDFSPDRWYSDAEEFVADRRAALAEAADESARPVLSFRKGR